MINKMYRIIISIVTLTCVSACSSFQQGYDVEKTGDSINIIHSYTDARRQEMDKDYAYQLALSQCQSAGYSQVIADGDSRDSCRKYTGYYECLYRQVEQTFHCQH